MDSYEENADGYFLDAAAVEWFEKMYVQDEIHTRNEYADRLGSAGVAVEHHHYESMVYGFVSMLGVLSQADDALDTLADRLETTF